MTSRKKNQRSVREVVTKFKTIFVSFVCLLQIVLKYVVQILVQGSSTIWHSIHTIDANSAFLCNEKRTILLMLKYAFQGCRLKRKKDDYFKPLLNFQYIFEEVKTL